MTCIQRMNGTWVCKRLYPNLISTVHEAILRNHTTHMKNDEQLGSDTKGFMLTQVQGEHSTTKPTCLKAEKHQPPRLAITRCRDPRIDPNRRISPRRPPPSKLPASLSRRVGQSRIPILPSLNSIYFQYTASLASVFVANPFLCFSKTNDENIAT